MLLCSSITERLPNSGFLLRNCNELIACRDDADAADAGSRRRVLHGVRRLRVVHLDASAGVAALKRKTSLTENRRPLSYARPRELADARRGHARRRPAADPREKG
jgi:hypothetical protein